eukprot:2511594-Amphidinium_carterae.1
MAFAAHLHHLLAPDVPRWREQILHDIAKLVDEKLDEHLNFLSQAPIHVAELYSDKVFPLVFLHLLALLNFPDAHLSQDMLEGFELIGTLNEGVGWPQRVDAKYSRPLSFSELYSVNNGYLSGLINSPRHDTHWQDLVAELDKEHKLKRVDGPYRLPPQVYGGPYHHQQGELQDLPDKD